MIQWAQCLVLPLLLSMIINSSMIFYWYAGCLLTFQTTTLGCLTRSDSPDIRFDPYRVHQASQFRGFNINIIRTPDLKWLNWSFYLSYCTSPILTHGNSPFSERCPQWFTEPFPNITSCFLVFRRFKNWGTPTQTVLQSTAPTDRFEKS